MITAQQNEEPKIRDHGSGGVRRERPGTCPRQRSAPEARRPDDLGPFGVPPWGGKDRSDPRKRGTPNEGVRNKANPPRSDRSGRGRARSPAEPSLGPLVQTKPICRHGRRWARAGESPPRRRRLGPLRQTNPICPAPAARVAARPVRKHCRPGGNRVKRSQLAEEFRCEVSSEQRPAAGPPIVPIPTSPLGLQRAKQSQFLPAKQRASALRKKSYDELDMQTASTKQSQFPREQQWARAGKAAGDAGGAPARQTKPICPAPAGRQGRERCRRGQACETKPISRVDTMDLEQTIASAAPQSTAVCRLPLLGQSMLTDRPPICYNIVGGVGARADTGRGDNSGCCFSANRLRAVTM